LELRKARMGRKGKNRKPSMMRTGSRRLDEENGLNSSHNLSGIGLEFNRTKTYMNLVSNEIAAELRKEEKIRVSEDTCGHGLMRDVLDITSTLEEGVSAIVDDSFTKCFNKASKTVWNFNAYLFPFWLAGVFVRYLVLFPLRLVWLLSSFFVLNVLFALSRMLLPKSDFKFRLNTIIVHLISFCWVASWSAVIQCHGPKPTSSNGRVYVSNHTSMIDWLVLSQVTPFATVMQKHPGWLGLVQTYIMDGFGCVYFNRKDAKDREKVAQTIKERVNNSHGKFPLLIFPEGTCVNNRYTTMFKKGAFELDCAVCPVAVKYNKIFVDAFWSSRTQSFTMHLFELMTSWAVVADVYFLEPQYKREGETSIEFASRVQQMIAKKAQLKIVPWNGMLKYFKPSPKLCEQKREIFGTAIKARLQAEGTAPKED